jgi:site-specific DNA-methyltransferase (adenine-specific)
MGSGSTGCAAMLEGFRFIGMEQSPEYAEIAQKRIEYWLQTSVKYEIDTNEPQMSILDVIDES